MVKTIIKIIEIAFYLLVIGYLFIFGTALCGFEIAYEDMLIFVLFIN